MIIVKLTSLDLFNYQGCDVKDGKKQGRRANNATIEDKPISSPDSANVIDTVSRTSSDAVLSTS